MTVMLLQRSASPQLTHSQKTSPTTSTSANPTTTTTTSTSTRGGAEAAAEKANEAPFLILLDIQEHAEPLDRQSSGYEAYANSNNLNNNNNSAGGGGGGGGSSTGAGPIGAGQAADKSPRKSIAAVGRSSTCGSASACGAAGGGCGGGAGASAGAGGAPSGPKPGVGLGASAGLGPSAGGLAMRYYRLWIYACNLVLLLSAVGFAGAVSHTLLFSGDLRRHLVPGVPRAHDPSALYAYLAFAVQLGLVQLLGCIAARRLSARLLHAYWLLLLALLFGDAVLGVAWVFRFERMRAELRPGLRMRLQLDYGKDARFSEQWDQLQRQYRCCGVTGPLDFGSFWPETCCPAEVAEPDLPQAAWPTNLNSNANSVNVNATNEAETEAESASNASSLEPCQNPMTQGCEGHLLDWLKQTADLLFVLGFCVIAFTKLCFLGILRYEIREMIQKIRLMREPPPAPVPFVQPFHAQPPPQQMQPTHHHLDVALGNGNVARRTTLPIVSAHQPTTGTTTSLFVPADESSKHPLLQDGGGGDSDTNSHCALILEESTPPAQHHATAANAKANANNNYEMREFNRRLLFTSSQSQSQASQSQVGQTQQQQQQQSRTHT